MERAMFATWIEGYERAWRTSGTDAIAELFAESATYRTAPFEPPHEGRAAIAQLWGEEREGPDEVFEMRFELVAVEGDTGVARVEVDYGDPVVRRYRDLWVICLDADGRCREFEEWPFWPAEDRGTYRPGPGQPTTEE